MRSMKLLHPKKWEERNAKISEKRLHQVFPRKDTKPEKYLQKLLDEIGVKYTKHKPILGQPDIFIHPNICVFADGDYWHANPKSFIYKNKKNPGFKSDDVIAKPKDAKYMWARDKKVNDGLKKRGYQILRFWHSEIEQNPKKMSSKNSQGNKEIIGTKHYLE